MGVAIIVWHGILGTEHIAYLLYWPSHFLNGYHLSRIFLPHTFVYIEYIYTYMDVYAYLSLFIFCVYRGYIYIYHTRHGGLWGVRSSVPDRVKSMTYKIDMCTFLTWCSALTGQCNYCLAQCQDNMTEWVFGDSINSLIPQWGSSMKLPWVHTVTSWYASWYDTTFCKDIKLQPYKYIIYIFRIYTIDPCRYVANMFQIQSICIQLM